MAQIVRYLIINATNLGGLTMDDKATTFSIVLGVVLQLASLGLAVSGFHHVNGLLVPMVLGATGTFMFWYPMIKTTLEG